MKPLRVLWCMFVLVLLCFHLLIGVLVAIATAFYWLLESRFTTQRRLTTQHTTTTDNPNPECLWCVMGNHRIGNESYSFYPDNEYHNSDEAYCLKCKEGLDRSINRILKDCDEKKSKEIEWEKLTEDERESRRTLARTRNSCPRCNRTLWLNDLNDDEDDSHSKGSCPLCHEFPFNMNAPMNHGWREREWTLLSETEKQARIEAARIKIDANFSEWAIGGSDGVWRRKDNGNVVESGISDATLLESAKGRYGWLEDKQ